ncbi:MAG: transposase [Gammaproteobacteria bacterium]|nr:transposase [Gammaproteobacteria bacterium]
MKQHHTYIGIDRSDQTIDYCQLNIEGENHSQNKIASSPENLLKWVNQLLDHLPENRTIALCIEQPCQSLVHFFSQFKAFVIYLENPAVIKKYRESLSASRAKDDKRDAAALAQFIYERHRRLTPYISPDPLGNQISILVEKRRQLVGTRTSLTNKLTQALKDYYPQALQLLGKHIYSPLSCAFLSKWSSLQELQKARPSTITQFYYKQNSRSKKLIQERLEIIQNAVPICTDTNITEVYKLLAESLVKAIQQIQTSINHFDKMIESKLAEHEDKELFSSLPGAGVCYAARLLSFFGSDRSQYQDASEIQKVSGVAPLTKQSGKMHFVHRRYACNKFFRQTFVEWAAQTISKSLWAKAYYEQ